MEINIAVCDSDIEVGNDIRNLILSQRKEISVKVFSSADDVLQDSTDFDIYFLDIQGISGMALSHEIRNKNCRSIIIFVTGFREHMEEAFDVQAFHYLLKPINVEKFNQVLNRALQELEFKHRQEDKYILFKIQGCYQKIMLKDIFYIESNDKKVVVHTTSGNYDVHEKISDLEIAFGEYFYRCHRCYLVNFSKISSYNQNEIEIINGDHILLAYKKFSTFVKAYLNYAKDGGLVNV